MQAILHRPHFELLRYRSQTSLFANMIEKHLLSLGFSPTRCVVEVASTTSSVYFEFGAQRLQLSNTRTRGPRIFLSIDSAIKTVRRLFPDISDVAVVLQQEVPSPTNGLKNPRHGKRLLDGSKFIPASFGAAR